MRVAYALGLVAFIGTAPRACRDVPARAPAAEDTSYRLRPGYVIDSVKPVEVELAAFRDKLGPAPEDFGDAPTSFDRLLADFARAVQAADTAALQRLQISAAEFAWLIYPSSPYTAAPYRQSPQLVWYQLRASGDPGLNRLLARRGGSPLRIVGHQCDPQPLVEGENKLWRQCSVKTVGASRDTLTEQLFGVVVERGGRFKFASYQNQY